MTETRQINAWWHWGTPENWEGARGMVHTDCGGSVIEMHTWGSRDSELERVCCQCKKRWRNWKDWTEVEE